jgi:hypothetical protein
VVFATFATAWWVNDVFFVEYNFLFDLMFTVLASPVNIGVLLLAVIPSRILYLRTRHRRDLMSLLLSGCSFVIVLVETVLVWFIKLHGE